AVADRARADLGQPGRGRSGLRRAGPGAGRQPRARRRTPERSQLRLATTTRGGARPSGGARPMSANTGPSGPARRALAREDLLTMAAAAAVAGGVVRQREMLPRRTEDEGNLFDLALKHQLGLALGKKGWAIKAQAWNRAAIIVRFSELVGSPVACEHTPEQMHANALRELQDKQLGT